MKSVVPYDKGTEKHLKKTNQSIYNQLSIKITGIYNIWYLVIKTVFIISQSLHIHLTHKIPDMPSLFWNIPIFCNTAIFINFILSLVRVKSLIMICLYPWSALLTLRNEGRIIYKATSFIWEISNKTAMTTHNKGSPCLGEELVIWT